MKKVLTYKGAVMTWECDSNRHMNVMYYINKFEHAGRNFDIELGLFKDGLSEEKGIVVLEQNIKYLKEVFEDDLLDTEGKILKAVFHKVDAHFSDLNLHLKEINYLPCF